MPSRVDEVDFISAVAQLKQNTKTKTLKQSWNVLAVSDMQFFCAAHEFCAWTSPAADMFQRFISRIECDGWNKTVSSTL